MQHDAHATTTLVASILNIRRDDPWKRSGALQSPPALDTPRGDQMVLACNSSNIIDVLLVWITSIIGRDDRAINARTRIALFPIRRTNVCRANPFFPTPPLPFFFYIPRSEIILRVFFSFFFLYDLDGFQFSEKRARPRIEIRTCVVFIPRGRPETIYQSVSLFWRGPFKFFPLFKRIARVIKNWKNMLLKLKSYFELYLSKGCL